MAGGLLARSGADAAFVRGWLGQRALYLRARDSCKNCYKKAGSKQQNQARRKLSSNVARCTLKFDPMLYLHNIEALWNAVRSYVPRNVVRLRKLGHAGLSALWADKFLSPLVAVDPQNMRRELGVFQHGTPPQSN